MGVDIIIPIYNAYDDLQICLQSVYQHTNLAENRLILINDSSSNERIRPYLDSQGKENIIVIHNKENKGFSNNINLGMEQSEERDVILLNSDTIVTSRWVEKMVECAYSDRSIGTVTPLSNNATLCSVPNFCEENTLPEGMDVDQMAAIVEECSLKKYPRITVANGFCMLIKREVINLIGKFDAETFGRGYGEENDFCNRAEQMGYIHVMCDDTYIYHSGTKSFVSKEKEAYIKEHEQILYKRYPFQMQKNAEHCRDNPNGWVGENIAMHFDIWNGRKNILYLLQSDFREGADDNVGGTQLHVKHLTMGLRKDMNVFVAARDRDYLNVTAYTCDNEYMFRFYIGENEAFPLLHNRELAEIFRTVLVGFKINLVHVHHTATTSLDIYDEADKLGIPVIFTVHDFYYVCSNEKLLDVDGQSCITGKNVECGECLNKKIKICIKSDYLKMWREKHAKVLGMCEKIVVPSESSKEILAKYYPRHRDKIEVIGHGMDKQPILMVDESKIIDTDRLTWKIEKIEKRKTCLFICGIAQWSSEPVNGKVILKITEKQGKITYLPTTYGRNIDVLRDDNRFYAYIPNAWFKGTLSIEVILYKDNCFYMKRGRKETLPNIEHRPKNNFRIAFIGGLNEEKGGKIVKDIIHKGPSDVEWYVLGGIGEDSLYQLKQSNLVKTGIYYQEDLSTWLKYYQIDVICILSKWAETFSYTLSEAVINNIPVIVTDIGALGQRTKEYECGVTVSIKDAVDEAIKQIEEWKQKSESYQKYKQRALEYEHKTIACMVNEYKNLYKQGEKNILRNDDITLEEKELLCDAMAGDIHTRGSNKELVYKIRELEGHIKKIEGSAAFRVMRKMYDINIPFKKEIRKIILKQS